MAAKIALTALAAAAILSLAAQANANLLIVPTFDSSITSDPNAVAIEAGINATIARVDADILNPVTVNITFQSTTTGSAIGMSAPFAFGTLGYNNYVFRLKNNQNLSANDNIAIASLPGGTTNPVDGNSSITATQPLLRALGIAVSPPVGTPDCVITLKTSVMNVSRSGAQNPSFIDLQGVAGHEIDEALGIGGSGSVLGLTTSGPVDPLDLYRYSANGVRSFTTSTNAKAYFSIDGGATDLVNFNQHGGGSDYGDWGDGITPADTLPNSPAQMQDAFVTSGVDVDIGPNELTALDIAGWDLTPAGSAIEGVPEPASCGILALGGVMLLARRRRGN